MESNDHNEDTSEEVCSLSETVSVYSSDDEQECNPLQEIVSGPSSSLLKEESDARNYDKISFHQAKRQHIINEDRVISEKKRRQIIRDKVDILQRMMTPNPPKMDYATKIDSVVKCIKILQNRRDVMAKVYTDAGYLPPYEQATLISPYADPWGYYAPTLVIPHQNMALFAQYPAANYDQAQQSSSQGCDTASDQTEL